MFDKALKHFKKTDPLLYQAALRLDSFEIEHSNDYFVSLCREIVGQQLSGKVASVIFERFINLFPKRKITATYLSKIPDQTIRDIGCAWSKVKYLKDLASKVNNKTLDLKNIDTKTNETVVEELLQVKGIGPWTTEMFLMFALGREDIFSPGDLGLKNAMKKLYKTELTNQEIVEISKKWSPYRTYACMILWQSLDNKPK